MRFADAPRAGERADRMRGASRYRQRTQLGSVGFRIDDHGRLVARWRHAEEDRSAMLDASGTPAVAFYPLENGLDFVLEYESVSGRRQNSVRRPASLSGASCRWRNSNPAMWT